MIVGLCGSHMHVTAGPTWVHLPDSAIDISAYEMVPWSVVAVLIIHFGQVMVQGLVVLFHVWEELVFVWTSTLLDHGCAR